MRRWLSSYLTIITGINKGKLDLRFLFWGLVNPRPFLDDQEARKLVIDFHEEFPMEIFYGHEEEDVSCCENWPSTCFSMRSDCHAS